MDLVIDKEFRELLWPLSPIESAYLEQLIVTEGCREALIVWTQGNILVDGHNRYEICTRNGIEFKTELRDFADRDAVCDWIDKTQAGRRNCPPDQYKIITGRIYNRRKAKHGGDRKSSDQFDHLKDKTAEQVAAELGIAAPTVRRNAQRAEVHDAMLEAGDTEAAKAAREVPQSTISEARKNPEQAASILKKPHVSNNSGEQDWYTPAEFIESARHVLGTIELDPASSDVAQGFINAESYYTKDDDGLIQDWRGKVWLNPPYANGTVEKFAEKLVESIAAKTVTSAIVLVNNATETRWFHLLANHATAICFNRGRIKFLDSTGEPKQSPLQGQAFFYFGKAVKRFTNEFKVYGFCVEGITSDC